MGNIADAEDDHTLRATLPHRRLRPSSATCRYAGRAANVPISCQGELNDRIAATLPCGFARPAGDAIVRRVGEDGRIDGDGF